MASKVLPLLAAAGAALILFPKKKKSARKTVTEPKVHDLSGIYAENAALGASADAMDFMRLPVGLSLAAPDVETIAAIPGASRVESLSYRDPSEGTVGPITVINVFAGGNWRIQFEDGTGRQGADGGLDTLGQIVTNLTPDAVVLTFMLAQGKAKQSNDVYDEPSGTMDALVNKALRSLKEGVDWPTSNEGLAADDPLLAVWNGMSLVASLAYQTQYNIAHG
jgi:hypothetical protein